MSRLFRFLACLALMLTGVATSELQEVRVGGRLEIYGAYYSDFFARGDGYQAYFPQSLFGRPLGPNGVLTAVSVGDDDEGATFFEQRTRLHVDAGFTEQVRAFIEFDMVDTWGDSFRSDYITGADGRSAGGEVELYQAFIQADEMWGLPMTLRIGRQELQFGSGWLVGADPGPDPFAGLSYDGVRVTYSKAPLKVDGWWAKLAEGFQGPGDNDVDFMGVYASFVEAGEHQFGERMRDSGRLSSFLFAPGQLVHHTLKEVGPFGRRRKPVDVLATFDVYWMMVRDGRDWRTTSADPITEYFEDVFDVDDYGTTLLHTVGTRVAGEWSGFDYELEGAYQWGRADSVGALFVPFGKLFGDTDASWSHWAAHGELGYTFETRYSPRVYLGGSYYEGEDNRDITLLHLLNPFQQGQASMSFNRLFSSWREDAFIDGSAMSNFWKVNAGVSANFPTEAVEMGFDLAYLEVLEPFERPVVYGIPFWTRTGADELGWQTTLYAAYAYSEDLSFEVGWSHYFTGEALDDGAFIDSNGLDFIGGGGSDDVDYVYFLSTLTF